MANKREHPDYDLIMSIVKARLNRGETPVDALRSKRFARTGQINT